MAKLDKYKPAFELGQAVWLKSDPDQWERIVTGYYISFGPIQYEVRCGAEEPSFHYLEELADKARVY